MALVYRATSPDGRIYIGITSYAFKTRRSAHFSSVRNPKTVFAQALAEIGPSAFKWDVLLEGLTTREARRVEGELIESLGSLHPHGFNSQLGPPEKTTPTGRRDTDRLRRTETAARCASIRAARVAAQPELHAALAVCLSQKGLRETARLIDVNQGSISKWRKGKPIPLKYAAALKATCSADRSGSRIDP